MIKAHGFQILTGFLLFKYELLRTNIGARERWLVDAYLYHRWKKNIQIDGK
jgi:hypothetical protein